MRRIVPGRLIVVANAEIESDATAQLPVVLEVHAIKLRVRIGGRSVIHGRIASERAEQVGGICVAEDVRIRVDVSIRREGRVEVEPRRTIDID